MNCLEIEEIDNTLEDAKALQRHGFINMEYYKQQKAYTHNGLLMFGDRFSKAIGVALKEANLEDSLKILRYWQQLCEQHKLLYQMYLAKEKASASGK